MPKALILVADGSEEIEFVTPYDAPEEVFTRAGFDVVSAGVNLKHDYAHLSRNIRLLPDHPSIPPINPSNFDVLLLPGGAPGAKTFSTDPTVLKLIHDFRSAGKYAWDGDVVGVDGCGVVGGEREKG
ncbi:hypothetical protein GRF29_19g2549557 [Pseudopithomyces chartarum]|uniref:D-lactate dehydratase n=1 Tax=Pseudopithomyces chartarum TaxID=1892770 RepID=A0AAN6RJ42_9PLEO|nr:hypothetical protein GRF29_19g2549557 [Pseudopithomyces chartarum]